MLSLLLLASAVALLADPIIASWPPEVYRSSTKTIEVVMHRASTEMGIDGSVINARGVAARLPSVGVYEVYDWAKHQVRRLWSWLTGPSEDHLPDPEKPGGPRVPLVEALHYEGWLSISVRWLKWGVPIITILVGGALLFYLCSRR